MPQDIRCAFDLCFSLTELDGTPNAVKIARWVWGRGKDGDYIKVLPIAIKL